MHFMPQKKQGHHHHKDLLTTAKSNIRTLGACFSIFHRIIPFITLGNRYIILITKFLEAVALPSIEENIINQVFWDNAIFCHGHPRRVLSNRGSNFRSKLMKEVSYIINVCKIFTSSYRLQCEGFIQPTNSTSTQVIAMHVNSNRKRLQYLFKIYSVCS